MAEDADAVAATHRTFAYLHGLPVPLDEVWSWVGDTPVDVTVIRDEKDCAAQAAKREAQLELEKRLEEVGALFGIDDRHAHRGRGGPPPPERPWFARSGPSAAAASELEYARVARLPRDLAADYRRAKEEAARPTREDLRMLRLERTRRAKTLRKLFDKLAIPVRQRPIADVYHPATLRPFSPGGGPIEWTRRPSVAWTWAPPKEEAPPLTPAEREERAARAAAQREATARMLSPMEKRPPRIPPKTRAQAEPYPDDFRPPPEAQAPAPAPEPVAPAPPEEVPAAVEAPLVPEPPATEEPAAPATAQEPARPPSPTPSEPLASAEEPSYACESYGDDFARAPAPSQDSYAADFLAPEPQPAPAPAPALEPEPLEAAPEPAPQPEEHGLQPRPSQISYETYSEDFAASAPASAPASAAPTPRGFFSAESSASGRRSSAEQSLREPVPDPDPEPAPEPELEPEPEPGPVSWEAWTPAPAPDPMPAFYWLMRREYEGDHAAPASTNSPGRGLVAAVARRAFHPEELPEMALDPGERLLILRDEYDPSPGWIFAAKGTSNAGYVPRNYLDIDDGPAE